MWRITAFLKRRDGLDRAAFVGAWHDLFAAIAAHDPAPRATVINLPMQPLSEPVTAMFGDRFDGVGELWFADRAEAMEVLAALSGDASLRARAAACIDRAGSHAWLAEVVPQIISTGDTFRFVVAGQVADGLTVAEAQTYWRVEHPRVFRAVEDFVPYIAGYTQMHGADMLDPAAIDWLARYDFYPMCADMELRSESDVAIAYSMPSYLAIVRPDEERFSKPGDMLSFASKDRLRLG